MALPISLETLDHAVDTALAQAELIDRLTTEEQAPRAKAATGELRRGLREMSSKLKLMVMLK